MALLRQLADGQCRSGESLGRSLGVSRAAVWKQVAQCRRTGDPVLAIKAMPGEGYCLPAPLDLLQPEPLRASAPVPLAYRPLVDSTQAEVRRELQGRSPPLVVVAEGQSGGRGRRGRQWHSGFARGLWWTMAADLDCPPSRLGGLSLACGAAVADVIADECGVAPSLKWPNDILLNDAKLGGILLEVSGEADGPSRVLLGVGLNTGPLSTELLALGASTLDLPASVAGGRQRLLLRALDSLWALIEAFATGGFEPWRQRWLSRHAWQDREVVVELDGRVLHSGRCLGVDDQGALRLQTNHGERAVHSGEVSLRCR